MTSIAVPRNPTPNLGSSQHRHQELGRRPPRAILVLYVFADSNLRSNQSSQQRAIRSTSSIQRTRYLLCIISASPNTTNARSDHLPLIFPSNDAQCDTTQGERSKRHTGFCYRRSRRSSNSILRFCLNTLRTDPTKHKLRHRHVEASGNNARPHELQNTRRCAASRLPRQTSFQPNNLGTRFLSRASGCNVLRAKCSSKVILQSPFFV